MHNAKCGGGCVAHNVCKVLLYVGGLNWGLIGLGMLFGKEMNVVYMLAGSMPTVEAIIYLLVGVSALMLIFGCRCRKCMAMCCEGEEGKMEQGM